MSQAARGAMALLFALAGLLVPSAARAAGDQVVERPASGERISTNGAYQIFASVDVATGEEVRGMEARLLSGGQPVGDVHALDFVEVQQLGPGMRRSRWGARMDPLKSFWAGGGALPNGEYRIEVRALLSVQGVPRDPQDWRGHGFVLDVDPPATETRAQVLDAGQRRVEVSWEPVSVPDFVRYLVQRKRGDDPWQDYREIKTADKTRWADVLTEDGSYAYRVRTFRVAAGGGERASLWSNGAVVHVRKPPPPSPPPEAAGSGTSEGGAAPPPPSSVRTAPRPRPPIWNGPDTYEATLDYGEVEPPPLASGPEPDAEVAAPGQLEIGGEADRDPRLVLVPVAGGLLLTVSAWHLRRFLRT